MEEIKDYDFIVGFTLFTPKGFRTMYRHFDKLDNAKMFTSNVNIKDNNKIYVDLKYWEDKIKAKIAKLEKELEDIELKNINKDEISKTTFYFIDRLKCKIGVLQSLLEKE